MHKRIETTVAKAKELRMYIEPLVTKAKSAFKVKDSEPAKSVHLRRIARKKLKNDEAVSVLFNDIGPKVVDRNGGYTRILKTGFREGDGGDTAIIEFVDFSYLDTAEQEKTDKKSKKKTVKSTAEETVDEGVKKTKRKSAGVKKSEKTTAEEKPKKKSGKSEKGSFNKARDKSKSKNNEEESKD